MATKKAALPPPLHLTSFQLAVLGRIVVEGGGMRTAEIEIPPQTEQGVYNAVRKLLGEQLVRKEQGGALYATKDGRFTFKSHLRSMGLVPRET